MCIDYYTLKKIRTKYNYLMPRVDDLFDSIGYIVNIDLKGEYH